MRSWIIRRATPDDWPSLADLLAKADLPLAGAQAHLPDFFLAFRDDVLIGSAGLERYGDTALLRSVAVAVSERGHGLGQAFVQQMLVYAASLGVRQVVLLTTTATDFFLRFGFQPISRAEFPRTAQASVEFQEACPASATAMSLCLRGATLMDRCLHVSDPMDGTAT
jgi:amino-acid N-acetyltransferase